jgi:hypothetical protein
VIRGYPDQPSLRPGEILRLHVSTANPQGRFRVDFYRQGENLIKMGSLEDQTGYNFAQLNHYENWGWPSYDFPIPGDWPTGAYIAMLVETDEQGNQISSLDETAADSREAKVLFVVKSRTPGQTARILYKLSLTTYHAYNYAGGGNLYSGKWLRDPAKKKSVNKVSMHRPGGGTGGEIPDIHAEDNLPGMVDPYDESSPRQTFAHWDVPFILWLEKNGYKVDYCTDLDLHEDPKLLTPYHLLLSVGHDEYWSDNMRAHVEAFIQQGGNVAFFSGNTCWWHIEFCDFLMGVDDELHPTAFIRDFRWWKKSLTSNPENALTGVSYRNAGGWWNGRRDPVGYMVQNAGHWLYEGTGLLNKETFGADERLVGYECDGALFTRDNQGFLIATGEDGTPSNFVILGIGMLAGPDANAGPGEGWHFELREDQNHGPHAATLGLYTNRGIVFTAATTDWARVLPLNQHVDRITRNVLNRLNSRAVRIIGPLSASGGDCPVVVCSRIAGEDKNVKVESQTDETPKQNSALARFQADTTGLPNQRNLRYKWTISGGDAVAQPPLDEPVFEAVMPSVPVPVTVTVTILDDTDSQAFGTLTFIPLSDQEYLQFQLWSRLRELAALAQLPFGEANAGVGEESSRLVFPLWDPLINRGQVPLVGDLEEIALGAQQLIRLAEQLSELAEKLIEYERGRTV